MIDEEKSFIAMCKFLAWLSFSLFITFFGLSNVLASEHDMGSWSNYTEVLLEIPGAGAPIGLNRDTYNVAGNFTQVYVNIGNISINKDYIYQLEISTPGSNFINVNSVLVTQIVGNNGINQSCNMLGYSDADIGYPKIYFQCPNSFSNGNMTFTLYNINGANLVSQPQYFKWGYTYFRYYDDVNEIDWGPVTSNANANADRIIANNNSNTNSIINNFNQKSTQDTRDIVNGAHQDANSIKNNQNANTDRQIDSQKVCETITYTTPNFPIGVNNYYLDTNGSLVSSNNFVVSDYIPIFTSQTYTLTSDISSSRSAYCLYNSDKVLSSCNLYSATASTFTGPLNGYIRFSIYNSQVLTFTGTYCKNGNQALSDNINNLNDNLNNDDTIGATSEAIDFFSSFSTDTFGLTSIITAPLNLINSVLSSTCTSLQLPLPYLNNMNLELPCMSSIYSQYFGTFFTIYQTITYGIIAYWVCVRIFNQVKDFKNPEHDEIEVMDL